MVATPRKSRVITISMSAEMAARAEALAKLEDRTLSELFREAFRRYQAERLRAIFADSASYAAAVNPREFTEEEIAQMVKAVRSEGQAEEARDVAVAG